MAEEQVKNLGCSTAKEFVDKLDKMARSKGYITIRDEMTQQMLKSIRDDAELYQTFQVIKSECKESYEYDHKTATMLDVNRGLTNLYGIVLNLIKASRNDTDTSLGAICAAINRIEEKIGLEPTDWNGGTENVAIDTGDGESVSPSGE